MGGVSEMNARIKPVGGWGGAARALLGMAMVAGLLAGCGGVSVPDEKAPTNVVAPGDGYVLAPGDQVRVTVFNQTNLSGEFQLDAVGHVAIPLIGNVTAGNGTAKALADRISQTLQQTGYLRDPQVNVEVLAYRPFYVLGEVKQPGEFPYTSGMSVLSAIARAGGYDYWAREGVVVLVRQFPDGQKEYRAEERTPILPGDIIRVTKRYY